MRDPTQTRWIWEPELSGVGWKELRKKEQTRFTFFCVFTWLLGSGGETGSEGNGVVDVVNG